MGHQSRPVTLAAVPLKPFAAAKGRLTEALDAAQRQRLGSAVAARTLRAITTAGARAAVVTADDAVAGWAAERGVEVIPEDEPGLNGAAGSAVARAAAAGVPWAVVHADLPLLTSADVSAVLAALIGHRLVLAPSFDGGTSVIAGSVDRFDFAYGPGSFHRHLARGAHLDVRVLVRSGLALDLDSPDDLERIASLPAGAWLREVLE